MTKIEFKSNSYINDLIASESLDENKVKCQAEIPQFFADSNVLITGASGFIGILLVEKLLRCCPDIKKLYIFMRPKKGKSLEERIKEQFEDPIYERLKKERPNFSDKIILIKADCNEPNLGLSPEDQERLLDTNVIFHVAATVRFNETIRNATNININGTKQLLLLAKKMPNLKVFLYVSTAFSHCTYKIIEEKFYPPPMATDKILELLDILDDKQLDALTPTLLGSWPNTYAYTKAISEDTVRQYSIGIPACIVRPSVVIVTAKEPVPGWINNIYGACGVVMGSGIGLLRTLHCDPENVAEVVPADYVISHIIAACWDTAKRKDALLSIEHANPRISEMERVPIYNYVSICQNPMTWRQFMKWNESGKEVPSVHCLWYYCFYLHKHLFVHRLAVFFMHMVPGFIVDVLLLLSGRKPMLLKTYKKINKFLNAISYFSSQEWKFRNDGVVQLWDRMNLSDRQMFNFNIEELDWEPCIKSIIPGMRVYIAKDPMDTLEQGKAKYRKLKIAHYTLMTFLAILSLWSVTSLVLYIMSFF